MENQITIHKLTPALRNDFLQYFDRDAFADNPHWASCYCYFFLAPHHLKPWEERTGQENRAAVSEMIAAGEMHGYLAYLDGKVAGWCHAAPRAGLPNLQREDELAFEDWNKTGAIVCFNVAGPYRNQGIASSLLAAACEGFREQGLQYAEAYPRTHAQKAAQNYHGPLQMFLSAGFTIAREYPDFAIVRKELR